MGGYTSKCEKKSKSLHPSVQQPIKHQGTYRKIVFNVSLRQQIIR
jgi:hypothetical protein